MAGPPHGRLASDAARPVHTRATRAARSAATPAAYGRWASGGFHRMPQRAWALMRATVEGYIEDDAMSRGAAIAYYTVFSIAPLLVIATAIAGLAFGQQAVEGALA